MPILLLCYSLLHADKRKRTSTNKFLTNSHRSELFAVFLFFFTIFKLLGSSKIYCDEH